MEMPREGTGWDTLENEYGEFHLARMLADPKTKALCAAFQARQNALEAKGQAFNASWKAQSRADAGLKKSDFDVDNLVRELYFDKIAACGNKKNDPGLKRWFPNGLWAIVHDDFAAELEKVRQLLSVLAETPNDPIAAQFIPRLKAQAENYQNAIAAFSQSVTGVSNAQSLINAEKVNWFAAYKKDYADILSIFDGDKHATDSYFKNPPKPPKKRNPPETKA